jgi:hypothetical protein
VAPVARLVDADAVLCEKYLLLFSSQSHVRSRSAYSCMIFNVRSVPICARMIEGKAT